MSLQQLGELLHSTRLEKGLTLADVEEATRIRQRYLEALEYGDENALPAPVYVEGFVRGYAGFLGLPGQEMVNLYRAGHAPTPAGDAALRPPAHKISLPETFNWPRAILAGVLVALLVVAATALLQGGLNVGTLGFPDWLTLGSGIQPESTPTPAPSPEPSGGEAQPTPETPVEPSPEGTPTPSPTPLPVVTVNLRFTGLAWIRVTVDDQVVFEGLMESGGSRGFTGTRSISLLTGNAGATEATVDGVARGVLGAPGQVVEIAWTRP